MEVPILRIIMVLLHRLLHTTTHLWQNQWAEEVPSRAPQSALEGCSSMLMDPQEFFQKRDRITREVNPTLSHKTENYGGESSSLLPLLHPRLLLCQAVEVAQLEDHASTITLATQPSRDTIVTMETTTTSPPAHSTRTHPPMCRHHTPLTASDLKRDVSEEEGRGALQWLWQPVARQRGGPSLGSAPTTTLQDHHSILTRWWVIGSTKNIDRINFHPQGGGATDSKIHSSDHITGLSHRPHNVFLAQ